MAETIIGIRCNDFVLLAATGTAGFYYIKFSDVDDKIPVLDERKILACSGENGSRVNFSEYVKCNLALNKIRSHNRECSTPEAANFMRAQLASAIRSRDGAYVVNTLLAGYDVPAGSADEKLPQTHLFYLDYLGTLQAVPYAAHGYGTAFVTGILDRYWKPDLTPQQGLELLQQCCNEVRKRVIISAPHFIVKVVTEKGVEIVTQVS